MRWVLAWLWLTLSGTAAAQDYPALFDVVGVARNDELFVRTGPGTEFEIIGSFEHDRQNIEVIRPDDDLQWGQVNLGETSGWVSLAFLERPNGPKSAGPDIRQCFGTEPFWSLAVNPPRITYSAPDIAPREGLLSSFYRSRSRSDRYAEIGSFFPSELGDRDIHLSIRVEACSDGMSDRNYGIAVDMLLTDPSFGADRTMTGLYSGCCSLTPPPGE